ncbi:ATP-binding protein [Streptomyces cyaneochromogenes]|uniref:ATP-binding protein n=1 Tax=Streptomyces cyaneochromogenes TaxID=2496836 RepID=UPI00225E1C45|nr:AAA family ATPase [Streptomyces cyaneochromogenes]
MRLTDIKGFSGRRAVDVRLPGRGGWTVLAGRNGSGKSTLLRAIALALCGPETAVALHAASTGMVTRSAPNGRVVVDVRVDPQADEFLQLETAVAVPADLRLGP